MGGSFPTTNSSPPEICPCGYELQISGVTIKNSDPPDGGPEFLVTRRRFELRTPCLKVDSLSNNIFFYHLLKALKTLAFSKFSSLYFAIFQYVC
jgi:hypothetical protein